MDFCENPFEFSEFKTESSFSDLITDFYVNNTSCIRIEIDVRKDLNQVFFVLEEKGFRDNSYGQEYILNNGRNVFYYRVKNQHASFSMSFRLLGRDVIHFKSIKVDEVERSTVAFGGLSWSIKCPANIVNRHLWGDYFFSKSLGFSLENLDQNIKISCYEEWSQEIGADVNLVIRGNKRFGRLDKSKINLLWVISHPDKVSFEEMNEYNAVLIASIPYWRQIQGEINTFSMPFLQCSNIKPKRFSQAKDYKKKFVFVGNNSSRGRMRPVFDWVHEEGIPIDFYGQGWDSFKNDKNEVYPFVDNRTLGRLYGSYIGTINEHWPDMSLLGFINNRVWDSMSSGCPIITDYGNGFKDLLGSDVLYYSNKNDFLKSVVKFMFNEEHLRNHLQERLNYVQMNFSFDRRASQLVSLVDYLQGLKLN